jgi:hypothetical protein
MCDLLGGAGEEEEDRKLTFAELRARPGGGTQTDADIALMPAEAARPGRPVRAGVSQDRAAAAAPAQRAERHVSRAAAGPEEIWSAADVRGAQKTAAAVCAANSGGTRRC